MSLPSPHFDPIKKSDSGAARSSPQQENPELLPPRVPRREYSSLSALFSREFAAPMDIRSRDESLIFAERRFSWDKPFIPELLKKIPEANVIWEETFYPSQNRDQILSRQAIITSSSQRSDLAALLEFKNQIYKFRAAIANGFFREIAIGDYEKKSALEIFRAGPNGRFANVYYSAQEAIEYGKANLELARGAISSLGKAFEGDEASPLALLHKELAALQERVKNITSERIIGRKCSESTANTAARDAVKTALRVGSLLELGALVQNGMLHTGTFDAHTPVGYSAGWNLTIPDSRQHTNDSPADVPVIMFSGSNMSGKTESGLKQVFFIQRWMQTWGVATIAAGNFKLHDDFFYFDRAATAHYDGLSAFGTEVGFYRTHYPTLGECPFGCIDEGFSTTDVEGQYRLLYGVKSVRKLEGGKLHYSNHNEEFNETMSRYPDAAVYHFETVTDGAGVTKFTYQMKPGVADSNSIAVAKALNNDSELIRRSEAAEKGEVPIADQPGALKFSSSVPQDETTRHHQKDLLASVLFLSSPPTDEYGMIGLSSKRERRSKDALVSLISIDEQLQNRYLLLGGSQEHESQWVEICGRRFTGAGSAADLKRLFLHGDRPSSEEILERQRTFVALAAHDRYEDLAHLNCTLSQTLSFISFTRHAADLFSANRALNPFGYRGISTSGGRLYLAAQAAIHFFNINFRMLGDQFPFKELREELTEIHDACACERTRLESMSVQDLFHAIEKQRTGDIPDRIVRRAKAFSRASKVDLPDSALASRGDLSSWINHTSRMYDEIPRKLRYSRTFEKLKDFADQCPSRFEIEKFREWYEKHARTLFSSPADSLTYDALQAIYAKLGHGSPEGLSSWMHEVYSILSNRIEVAVPALLHQQKGFEEATTTLHQLECALERILHKFTYQDISQDLPRIAWDALGREIVEEEVLPLVSLLKKYYSGSRFEESEWPRALEVGLAIELAYSKKNIFEELGTLLRSYDSVHTHQAANSLERAIFQASLPQMEYWWRDEEPFDSPEAAEYYLRQKDVRSFFVVRASEQKVAEVEATLVRKEIEPFRALLRECALSDPRQVFPRLRQEFERTCAELWRDLEVLENRKFNLERRFPHFTEEETCRKVIALEQGPLRDRGDMVRACEAFAKAAGQAVPTLNTYLDSRGRDYDRYEEFFADYREKYAVGSPVFEQAKNALNEHHALTRQIEQFFTKHKLYREHGDRCSVSLARYRAHAVVDHRLGWVGRLQEGEVKNINRTARHISNMFLWGHATAERKYGKVNFTSEGVIEFKGLTSLFADENHVRQDLRWDHAGGVVLITGPNMSGKTTLLKKVLLAVGAAHQTGIAPCESATMPFLRRLIYIDRVTGKQERNLSSMGAEMMRMDSVLADVRTGEPVLLLSDEAFSTMSARYQGYFSTGLLSELHDLGQFALFASHHHDSVDVMSRASSYFVPIHLHYETDLEEGKVKFSYLPAAGHAPSEAIAVARTYQMPEEILQGALAAPGS